MLGFHHAPQTVIPFQDISNANRYDINNHDKTSDSDYSEHKKKKVSFFVAYKTMRMRDFADPSMSRIYVPSFWSIL